MPSLSLPWDTIQDPSRRNSFKWKKTQQQNAQNWSHNKGLFFSEPSEIKVTLKEIRIKNRKKKREQSTSWSHTAPYWCTLGGNDWMGLFNMELYESHIMLISFWRCFCVFRHLLMRCKCTHKVDAWPTPNEHAHEPSVTAPQRVTTVRHACLFTPHTQMAPHGDAERWKEVEEFTSSTKSGNNNNLKKWYVGTCKRITCLITRARKSDNVVHRAYRLFILNDAQAVSVPDIQ